jgi:hypothetical protein
MYRFLNMENEFASLKSELGGITLWNRLFSDLEHPDAIDNDACVARFCRAASHRAAPQRTFRK